MDANGVLRKTVRNMPRSRLISEVARVAISVRLHRIRRKSIITFLRCTQWYTVFIVARGGYRATLLKQVLDGARSVDVALERGKRSSTCEISITTSSERELKNLEKCFEAGFDQVVMLSGDNKHIRELRKHVKDRVAKDAQEKVWFSLPNDFIAFLDMQAADEASTEQKVRGYIVKTRNQALDPKERDAKRQSIASVILQSMKR